jgi:hypothetical protein
MIVNSENFDVFYAFTNSFDSLCPRLQRDVVGTLVAGLSSLTLQIPAVVSSKSGGTSDTETEKSSRRNALKMYCTLLCVILKNAETSSRNVHVVKQKKTEKKKDGKEGKKVSKAVKDATFDWPANKETILSTLVAFLECKSFSQLWKMAAPEAELGNICFQNALLLLESSENTKNQVLREVTFQLFILSVVRFDLQARAPSALLHLLTSNNAEHLATSLPRLLQLSVDKYKSPRLLADVITDVVRIDPTIIARDSAGAKNVSSFLAELADLCPAAMVKLVPLLLPMLDQESYMLRNGVVQVMGSLVKMAYGAGGNAKEDQENLPVNTPIPADKKNKTKQPTKHVKPVKAKKGRKGRKALDNESPSESEELSESDDAEAFGSAPSDADEASADRADLPDPDAAGEDEDACGDLPRALATQSREGLLDLLMERVHDVNSFTRSRVLQTWLELVSAKAIPLARYASVAALAADRVADKAASVRKFAMQLLARMLEFNPFGPSLALSPLQALLERAGEDFKAKLALKQAQLGMAADAASARENEAGRDGNDDDALGSVVADLKAALAHVELEADVRGNDNGQSLKQQAFASAGADAELALQRSELTLLYEAVKFAGALTQACPCVAGLLKSTTNSDVLEAVRFFVQVCLQGRLRLHVCSAGRPSPSAWMDAMPACGPCSGSCGHAK